MMSFSQSANTVILTVENHQDRNSFCSFNEILHVRRYRLLLLTYFESEIDDNDKNKDRPECRDNPVE